MPAEVPAERQEMEILEIRIVEPHRAELVEGHLADVPEPHQVRIRNEFSAISSGTELAVFTGIHQWLPDPDIPRWSFPFAAGYSACGVVEEVGSEVERLVPGTRVAHAGNHASSVVWNADDCWVVPGGLPSASAAFACVGRSGWGAAARVGTTMGRSVLVLGLGVIGQFSLRTFVAAGARPVIGLDRHAPRRELATRGGATATLDPSSSSVEHDLSGLLADGPQADIVADATGRPAGVMQAMSLTKDGGQCVIVSSPRGTLDGVNFYPDLHRRCIEVLGAQIDYLGWPLGARLVLQP